MSRLKVPTFASSGWGPWEDRSHLSDDPRAPDGLRGAWLNRTYSVQLVARNGLEVLMIRRHDGQAHFPWTDLQKIKDQLVGEDREAVQTYPRRGEIVDSANMAHLWLVPEGSRLPYTFERLGDVPEEPQVQGRRFDVTIIEDGLVVRTLVGVDEAWLDEHLGVRASERGE